MTGGRTVRILPEFFQRLDAQLPDERGPNGEPTAAEFAATDLLEIVDLFATRWDDLPTTFPGRTDYRALTYHCRLVHAAFVHGQLSPADGAVELVEISLDLVGLDDPEDDGELSG